MTFASPLEHPLQVERELIFQTRAPDKPSRKEWGCWVHPFCCSPEEAPPDPDTIPNWSEFHVSNQYSMLSGGASRLLCSGDQLALLNGGLNDLPFLNDAVTAMAKDSDLAIQTLAQFKHQLQTDAAGISRQSIDQLVRRADDLRYALEQLDRLAKKPGRNGQPSVLLQKWLWQPVSVSPGRPHDGAGPPILTPMDRFRSDLSLDIEALKALKARIPA